MNSTSVPIIITTISFAILIIAVVLTFIRLIKGPDLADRVAALDLTAFLIVALIGVHSIHINQSVNLDVGMALALIAFLGTVAFARYIDMDKHQLEDIDSAPRE